MNINSKGLTAIYMKICTFQISLYTVHTKSLLCYWRSSLFGTGWRTSYDWWATAMKQSSNMQNVLMPILLWLRLMYSECGMNSQDTSRLLNTCITGCNEIASNELCVSRSLTINFSISSAEYIVYITCGCLQRDSVLRGEHICAIGCDKFAGNELCLPRTSTIVFFDYLSLLEDHLVQQVCANWVQ